MSKFYNVVTRKVIPSKEGTTIYHKVGTIKITKNGGWFLQMYHQPETDFLIFPNQKDELPVINIEDDHA